MIVAYFSETQKYLQKDDYKKEFEVNNLIELIGKIKVKEPVLIKSTKEEIDNFKVFNLFEGDFEYEIISGVIPLTSEIISSDLNRLARGDIGHVLYKTKSENVDLLGNKVYIVADKIKQQYFIQNKGVLALTLDDLKEKVDIKKVVKVMFDGKEIENECV